MDFFFESKRCKKNKEDAIMIPSNSAPQNPFRILLANVKSLLGQLKNPAGFSTENAAFSARSFELAKLLTCLKSREVQDMLNSISSLLSKIANGNIEEGIFKELNNSLEGLASWLDKKAKE
jgi:hypothetical protein